MVYGWLSNMIPFPNIIKAKCWKIEVVWKNLKIRSKDLWPKTTSNNRIYSPRAWDDRWEKLENAFNSISIKKRRHPLMFVRAAIAERWRTVSTLTETFYRSAITLNLVKFYRLQFPPVVEKIITSCERENRIGGNYAQRIMKCLYMPICPLEDL